jgi:hypothetical protein
MVGVDFAAVPIKHDDPSVPEGLPDLTLSSRLIKNLRGGNP